MRTAKEEAIARLKAVQDKFQSLKGDVSLPADQLQGMFAAVMDAVNTIKSEPGLSPARRIAAGFGDEHFKRQELIAALPRDVQKEIDGCVIASALTRKPIQRLKMWNRLVEESGELKKALDSTTAGEGDEWVPTSLSPNLVAEVTQLGGVEQMHPHLAMPTNPYDVPLQTSRLTTYAVSEQTADSGQTAGTKSSGASISNKLTLTAAGLQTEVLASKNVQEDSLVPIMPFLRGEVIMSLVRGIEEACINGDTTSTHMDTDVEAAGSDDRRTVWKGYRKHALEQAYSVDFAGAGNGFDYETWLKVRAQLGKYGINPNDLFWLSSLNVYFKALSLKDSAGNSVVVGIDKMPNPTNITGVLGFMAGSPILVSEFMRDDLNASGVNGAVSADNVKGAIACVQKSGFVFGDRRDATLQVLGELYAEYQQDALLVTMRKAFAPMRPIASNKAVALGYNIETA